MERRYFLALGVAAFAAPLVGCGTTEDAVQPEASGASPGSGEAITITDGRGKEVTLAGPATTVVTLEWGNTEDLITLGVQPAGVADIKGYRAWVSSAAITGTPVDVGLRGEPSLVILDLGLPDMNGWEVFMAMRQEPESARIPVIILSSEGTRVDRSFGLQIAQVHDYLVKPCLPSRLRQSVVTALAA